MFDKSDTIFSQEPPHEIEEGDKNLLYKAVYYSDQLDLARLYALYPFNRDKQYQNPGNVIKYILMILSWAKGINLETRNRIFSILCAAIPEYIQDFSIKDCSYLLNSIVEILHRHQSIKIPVSAVNSLFGYLQTQITEADADSLRNILWSYAKLVDAKLPVEINVELVQRAFNQMNTGNVKMDKMANTVWALTKLITLDKLPNFNTHLLKDWMDQLTDGADSLDSMALADVIWSLANLVAKGVIKNLDASRVEKLLARMYVLTMAKPQTVASNLQALAQLSQCDGLSTITIDAKKIELLVRMFLFHSVKPKSKEIVHLLWAVTILIEKGRLAYIQPAQITSLIAMLHGYHETNADLVRKSVWSLAKLVQLGWPVNIDNKIIEDFIIEFNKYSNVYPEIVIEMAWAINQLIMAKKLSDCLATSEFVKKYPQIVTQVITQTSIAEEKVARPGDPRIEAKLTYSSIEIEQDSVDKFVLDLAQKVESKTGKKVFLAGSRAARAGLPKQPNNSDYDWRIFDFDEKELIQYFSQFGKCKKIEGKFPCIRLEVCHEGQTYLVEIATNWHKNPNESDDEAMLRKLNNGGINLERLYIPLTQSPLEIRGSEFAVSTYKQNRLSMENPNFIKEDPIRALRIGMKIMDFPDFRVDPRVNNALRDATMKQSFHDYLMGSVDNRPNIGRFSTTLENWLSRYKIADVIKTMDERGILDGIINLPNLKFADLESTLGTLDHSDHYDPYMKRMALSYFLLAHFCAQHAKIIDKKEIDALEKSVLKVSALDSWQLTDVIWNSVNPFYQDFIIRRMLKIETSFKVNITEPNFLAMIESIEKAHDKSQNQRVPRETYTRDNINTLFATLPDHSKNAAAKDNLSRAPFKS